MTMENKMESHEYDMLSEKTHLGVPEKKKLGIPAGLEYLYSVCQELYPDQPNPLQVTAVLKYWLGGPDPLDYISMYYNPGNKALEICPHWHYISFGLSDLHGDGRVHYPANPLPNEVSGFGFELTMRVSCPLNQTTPPTWPATLLQSLANYVFKSGTIFCIGDHISWHCSLDGHESRLQHMLVSEDSKLSPVRTPFGSVSFLQIVGVTQEEVVAAQQWNGNGILNILTKSPETGGAMLVTDMSRKFNIFEFDLTNKDKVLSGIKTDGSNLSGVSSKFRWSLIQSEMRNPFLQPDIEKRTNKTVVSSESFSFMWSGSTTGSEKFDSTPVDNLDSLHLIFNYESGSMLPLAMRGRLKHGRHFSFKSLLSNEAITFLTADVAGAFVSMNAPFATRGPWLQVLIKPRLLEKMMKDFCALETNENSPPITFCWPDEKLRITIETEKVFK